jgi:hypothetical protein
MPAVADAEWVATLFRRAGGPKGRYSKFCATGFASWSQAFEHARDLHRRPQASSVMPDALMYGPTQLGWASRCSASADALTVVAPSAAGGASTVTLSGIVLVLLSCRRIAHFRFRRHSGPCPDFPLAQSVENDPKACCDAQDSPHPMTW